MSIFLNPAQVSEAWKLVSLGCFRPVLNASARQDNQSKLPVTSLDRCQRGVFLLVISASRDGR
eukprot:scaffold23287_cov175-Amphora_coffeaeformis.AAC.8